VSEDRVVAVLQQLVLQQLVLQCRATEPRAKTKQGLEDFSAGPSAGQSATAVAWLQPIVTCCKMRLSFPSFIQPRSNPPESKVPYGVYDACLPLLHQPL